MLIFDLTGRVSTLSCKLEELHQECKKIGLSEFKNSPYPHYVASKEKVQDIKGLYNTKEVRPQEVLHFAKRTK